jgi:hypothetical protein
MTTLIQELDRAIERGWANCGHLAAMRELAIEELGQPQAEPVGEWVMVPREPTPAMAEAMARNAVDGDFDKDLSNGIKEKCVRLAASDYRAALAAAPQPQPRNNGDGQLCKKCGSEFLDTGWECTDCGHDNQAAYAAPQPQAAMLTNPYTGTPRDYRDVEDDPTGVLIQEPGAPIYAAPPRPQASAEDVALVDDCVKAADHYDNNVDAAWQRIRADYERMGVKS